jgi:hypothetical protein
LRLPAYIVDFSLVPELDARPPAGTQLASVKELQEADEDAEAIAGLPFEQLWYGAGQEAATEQAPAMQPVRQSPNGQDILGRLLADLCTRLPTLEVSPFTAILKPSLQLTPLINRTIAAEASRKCWNQLNTFPG